MLGGLLAGAMIGGAALYSAWQQAGAASDAAATASAAAVRVAQIEAEASRRASEIEAQANERAAAMEMYAMMQSIRMQQQVARQQMEQSERFAIRDELRMVTGQAVTDTFEKVSSSFVAWAQNNNIAEEQRLREQFGLMDDPRFEPPAEVRSTYELMTTDLLTGESTEEENPYRLSTDEEREMDREIDDLYGPQEEIDPNEVWDILPEDIAGEARRIDGDAGGVDGEMDTDRTAQLFNDTDSDAGGETEE